MKKNHLLAPLLGTLVAAIYVSSFLLALSKYPHPFSPVSNWLSDLGDRTVSPIGSAYYNAGVSLTGAVLVVFFLAQSSVRLGTNRAQQIVLALSQGFGIVGAAAMILSGVFSIDVPARHSFVSAILRICIGTSFGLSVAALSYYKDARKWILVVGGAATFVDLCVSVFFNKVHLLEWPVILLFLTYCLLLGIEVGRLGRRQSLKNASSV